MIPTPFLPELLAIRARLAAIEAETGISVNINVSDVSLFAYDGARPAVDGEPHYTIPQNDGTLVEGRYLPGGGSLTVFLIPGGRATVDSI